MKREIVTDTFFLKMPCADAVKEDLPAAHDLIDTLRANSYRCVGMAANMIGIRKKIIVFTDSGQITCMFNPVIRKKSGPYEIEESCLSFSGSRKTTRYESIEVSFRDISFNPKVRKYSGYTAQIIQHEIDHCSGILI